MSVPGGAQGGARGPGPMTADGWVADGVLEHLHGVPFHQAQLPRRVHVCRAQTRGHVGGSLVERCACGGLRRDKGSWLERNSARKSF